MLKNIGSQCLSKFNHNNREVSVNYLWKLLPWIILNKNNVVREFNPSSEFYSYHNEEKYIYALDTHSHMMNICL